MKKLFTSLFLFLSLISINAQTACPGCTINLPEGLSVDTMFLSDIPSGKAGQYYEEDISFRLPLSTTPVAATDPTVLPGLTIDEITIVNVANLPAGINWEANQSSYLMAEGTDGCIKLCGIPIEVDSFAIDVELNVRISFLNNESHVDLDMEILSAENLTEGFNLLNNEACGSLTAGFENNVPSNGKEGFSYLWDFGNGNSSTQENPPSQTYSEPGIYEINYSVIIDTIGFILNEISVNTVACGDLLSKPDLYVRILDQKDSLIYQTTHVLNQNPPLVVFPNIKLTEGDYTLQVVDEDSGLDGGDDVCTVLSFTQESDGNFSSSDWDIDISILHPLDTISSKDTVVVYELPEVPIITKRGELVFCAGESVLFTSSFDHNNVWYKDGEAISGAGEDNYEANATGSYQVAYTSAQGCTSISDPMEITVHPIPIAPSFTAEENVLLLNPDFPLSADLTLQWYFNGQAIEGEIGTAICSTESGTYRLVVTDNTTGCTGSFETDIVHDSNFDCLVAVEELDATQIDLSIFPNPVANDLTIKFHLIEQADVQINIYDLLGRKLKTIVDENLNGLFKKEINTREWSDGIYLLDLSVNGQRILKKIVKA